MPRSSKSSPGTSPHRTQRPSVKRFTHGELIDEIRRQLDAHGSSLPAPSMPTVKSWARQGLVDQTEALQSQAGLAVQRILERARYYSGRAAPQGRVSPPPPEPSLDDQALAQVLARLGRIESAVQAAIRNIGNSAGPAAPGGDAQGQALTKAIGQLDSVRMHIMRRFDAEVTLIRQQQSAGGPTPNSPAGNPLDSVRIEGRLNRLENTQGQILTLLQELALRLDRQDR